MDVQQTGSGKTSTPDAVEHFLNRTATHRSGSAHTRRAYTTDLQCYFSFLETQGMPYSDADRTIAARFVLDLSARGLAPRTVNRRVSCVRSFYRFLVGLGYVTTNPFDAVDTPTINLLSETHKVLSRDEFEACLKCLRTKVTATVRHVREAPHRNHHRLELFYATRRRAMFVFLGATGLRRHELLGLQTDDLEQTPSGYRLTVVGKGRKRRTLPLSSAALPAMVDWLTIRQRMHATKHLFAKPDGEPCSVRSVRNLMAWIRRRVPLRHRLHPHMLRRSFATWHLAAHRDIRTVQALLGHADIGTTQIYTAVEEETLRDAVRRAPIAHSEARHGPLLERLSSRPSLPTP